MKKNSNWKEKENNPLCMSKEEFENYKKNNKYCNHSYEFYRLFPLFKHGSKEESEFIIFSRTHDDVELLKKAYELLSKNKKK